MDKVTVARARGPLGDLFPAAARCSTKIDHNAPADDTEGDGWESKRTGYEESIPLWAGWLRPAPYRCRALAERFGVLVWIGRPAIGRSLETMPATLDQIRSFLARGGETTLWPCEEDATDAT